MLKLMFRRADGAERYAAQPRLALPRAAAVSCYLGANLYAASGRAGPLRLPSFQSGKGLCCSLASVQDVDWDTKDGRYQVRL